MIRSAGRVAAAPVAPMPAFSRDGRLLYICTADVASSGTALQLYKAPPRLFPPALVHHARSRLHSRLYINLVKLILASIK